MSYVLFLYDRSVDRLPLLVAPVNRLIPPKVMASKAYPHLLDLLFQ